MHNKALTSTTAKQPLARVLALVALLCAGALQVQEANHGHWDALDDGYSQCLLCQSAAEASLPQAAAIHRPLAIAAAPVELASPLIVAVDAAPFQARGPPVYS